MDNASDFFNSLLGVDAVNGASMFSYGNNQIDQNNIDGPDPKIIPQK